MKKIDIELMDVLKIRFLKIRNKSVASWRHYRHIYRNTSVLGDIICNLNYTLSDVADNNLKKTIKYNNLTCIPDVQCVLFSCTAVYNEHYAVYILVIFFNAYDLAMPFKDP